MPDKQEEDVQLLLQEPWWAVIYNPEGIPTSVRSVNSPDDAVPPEVAVYGERPRIPGEPL